MLQKSRYESLTQWLSEVLSKKTDIKNLLSTINLEPMTGDAGFRQYYRFVVEGHSFIVVDAPPAYSNNQAFVAIQQSLLANHINVPEIIDVDLERGFFCLSDFGDKLLADGLIERSNKGLDQRVNSESKASPSHRINKESVQQLYLQAIALLPVISTTTIIPSTLYSLPIYDRAFIEMELSIFSDWLLNTHLSIALSSQELIQLESCFSWIIDRMIEQPQVTMHRDFHSRNIMMLNNDQLGIIDFQDAVKGPITYDIVSLLRDCYVRWPDEIIEPLLVAFCDLMTKQHDLAHISLQQWNIWFDLTGLQRHLKASGIFCRLNYRDNKCGYLKDVPLTLTYIKDISKEYPELSFLHSLVIEKVMPAMQQLEALTNSSSEFKSNT